MVFISVETVSNVIEHYWKWRFERFDMLSKDKALPLDANRTFQIVGVRRRLSQKNNFVVMKLTIP